MEIKLSVTDLKNAISIVKRALPKIILQEERGHVLCELEKNTLIVSATNNDIKAKVSINVSEYSDPDISFTLDPKIVEKILTKIDINETVFDYNPDEKTVKIYTTENLQSFTTLQSFPPEKMLTFKITEEEEKNTYSIDKSIVLSALEFANSYLAPLKDNKKQYDFIIINNGIVYGANGVNRMGFFVSTAFKDFKNFKIRKESVPFIVSVLKSIKEDNILFFDTKRDVGVETPDKNVYFSCLKSGIEAPKINTDLLKGESPYTKIDKNKLLKTLDRLVASSNSSIGAGVEFDLKGINENATVAFNLISNLKTVEKMECVRINDTDNEDISHVLDFKLFKTIIDSFGDRDIRLYINDSSKFFKVTCTGEVGNNKYMSAGIGSYSKVVNNG